MCVACADGPAVNGAQHRVAGRSPPGGRAAPDRGRSGDTGAPELRDLNVYRLIERAGAYRPGTREGVETVTKRTLRMLARRAAALEDEVKEIDATLKTLVAQTAPELVARVGAGTDTASALLVAAGDNPGRLRGEATFAHLGGASPIDASSGKHERHRLNLGGDRQTTRRSGRSSSPVWSTTPAPALDNP